MTCAEDRTRQYWSYVRDYVLHVDLQPARKERVLGVLRFNEASTYMNLVIYLRPVADSTTFVGILTRILDEILSFARLTEIQAAIRVLSDPGHGTLAQKHMAAYMMALYCMLSDKFLHSNHSLSMK